MSWSNSAAGGGENTGGGASPAANEQNAQAPASANQTTPEARQEFRRREQYANDLRKTTAAQVRRATGNTLLEMYRKALVALASTPALVAQALVTFQQASMNATATEMRKIINDARSILR